MSEITALERLIRSLRLRTTYETPGVLSMDNTDHVSQRAAEELERLATLETALRTIQDAVPKYLKKEMTAEEFIDAVIAAADDRVVVRAVREAKASDASPER